MTHAEPLCVLALVRGKCRRTAPNGLFGPPLRRFGGETHAGSAASSVVAGLGAGSVERSPADRPPCRVASLCDDAWVTDEVLADQVDYYRRRAGEYDVTAYGDVAAARARIARLVAEMRPTGRVLEIACGTGVWTVELAGGAVTVTAIDAAPEAVAIARDRVRLASVSFEVADVFSWDPGTRFEIGRASCRERV